MAARPAPFQLTAEVLEDLFSPLDPNALHAFSGTSRRYRRFIRSQAHRLPQRLLQVHLDLRSGQGEVANLNRPAFRIAPSAFRPMRLRALRSGRVERVRIHSMGGYPVAAPTAARRLFRYRRYIRGAAVNIVDMPGDVVHCAALIRACAMASHIDFNGPPTRSASWFADAAGHHLHLVHSAYLTRVHTFNPLAIVDWLLAPSNSERALAFISGCPLTYEVFRHLIFRIMHQDALVQHRVQLHVDDRPEWWGILPIELAHLHGWAEQNSVQNARTLVRWTYGHCVTGATLTIEP